VPAMFDGVVSLCLINGFATNRTKPNMNPPMAVPYITEANTQTQLPVTLGASFHCCSFSATVAHGLQAFRMYLPPGQHAALPASAAVTAVTGYSSSTLLFFGRCGFDVQSPNRRPPTTALSKKM